MNGWGENLAGDFLLAVLRTLSVVSLVAAGACVGAATGLRKKNARQ